MLNVSVILEDSAKRHSSKEAFINNDFHLSFLDLNNAANKIANGLKRVGIKKGDKVALSCINTPQFPMVYFGILKAGAIVVPLSILLKREEVAYHLTDSDAKLYFCFEGVPGLPMLEEGYAGFKAAPDCEHFYKISAKENKDSSKDLNTLNSLMKKESSVFETVETISNDTAVIIYTSGTTGKPKGAELTHSNLLLNAILSADIANTQPEDTLLIVLPLFHIFAMTLLMNSGIYRGAKSILLPRFDPETTLKMMEKHKVSIFAGVPTMYWGLLNHKDKNLNINAIANNLKICISGGAALPVKVLENFETKYKVKILEGFGMSEGSPVVTFNHKENIRKPGSVGTAAWGIDVKVVDDNGNELPVGEKGELVYKGHNVMKGYYKRPEVNAKVLKNGWLHSGDVAIKDEDGFFFIVDRTKDMIIRGGLNVYPREIEETMMQHESISMVAVIGIKHEKFGEEIQACVVLKEGKTITENELIDWTKKRIAAYKYPRVIKFMDSLPTSATGKILKKELKAYGN
ncbi:long-chain fatty acid--CoA ligase [uncultured Maribacter sp.]|uniref:long-chain-fatty-acid--CoA ligase n=1 Tax=uncultured Maribacter sp. TaxID=431308 RepID=UPI00261B636B|nr:long-chain fatty acid--CoA ligase [uncultured Maribacter sp.]